MGKIPAELGIKYNSFFLSDISSNFPTWFKNSNGEKCLRGDNESCLLRVYIYKWNGCASIQIHGKFSIPSLNAL